MPAKRKSASKQGQQRVEQSQQPESSSRSSSSKRQKHSTDDESKHAFENDDMEHSVLGGLSGGYRVTGDESTDPSIRVYKVPFNDKFIICEHRAQNNSEGNIKRDIQKHEDRGEETDYCPQLIFTHGAGGGISNPATASFAEGFSRVSPIMCFQGTMNLVSRVKTFHTVIDHGGWGSALGGRSMGARAAVITANESEEGAVKALVLVSYPLVGGKKSNKADDVRDGILKELDADVDVLFITGDSDSMCPLDHLELVRRDMTATSWMVEVRGADHSMSLKTKDAVERVREKTGAIAAAWLNSRDRDSRYCLVRWDDDRDEISVSDWQ